MAFEEPQLPQSLVSSARPGARPACGIGGSGGGIAIIAVKRTLASGTNGLIAS